MLKVTIASLVQWKKKQFMWLCNVRYVTLIFFFSNNSLKIANGIEINIRIRQCDFYEVISHHFNRPTSTEMQKFEVL